MGEIVTAIPTGVTAFSATNIDDLVILMLFFSQVNATFRRWHIIAGQYLGFSALVIASLPGFFGGLLFPHSWIKLLGFLPIAIGLWRLLAKEEDAEEEEVRLEQHQRSPIASLVSPQTYSVAAVAFANGSDNISIYIPLFASSTWLSLVGILSVFFVLVGVWCYATYQLTRQPAIAYFLTRYGSTLVPSILIGLGVFIVWESASLTLLAVVVSYLFWIGLSRMSWRLPTA